VFNGYYRDKKVVGVFVRFRTASRCDDAVITDDAENAVDALMLMM
jgi:hypothetical protein